MGEIISLKKKAGTRSQYWDEDKYAFDKIRLQCAEKIKAKMLPKFYQSLIVESDWNVCYISALRAAGKTYNCTLAVLHLALFNNQDVVVGRRYEKTLKDSLLRSFLLRIKELDIDGYFKNTADDITFKIGSHSIRIVFKDLTKPDSFKSLEGYPIAWVDESQQIRSKDWDLILPTIRSTDGSHKFLITGNIPEEGKTSPLYDFFVVNPHPTDKYVALTFEDNPQYFKSKEFITDWVNRWKRLMKGRKNRFSREIMGIWTESNPYKIIRNFQEMEELTFSPDYHFIPMSITAGELYAALVHYTREKSTQLFIESEYSGRYDVREFISWIDSLKISRRELVLLTESNSVAKEIRHHNIIIRKRESPEISQWWDIFSHVKITCSPDCELMRDFVNETVFDVKDEGGLTNKIKRQESEPFPIRALTLALV